MHQKGTSGEIGPCLRSLCSQQAVNKNVWWLDTGIAVLELYRPRLAPQNQLESYTLKL